MSNFKTVPSFHTFKDILAVVSYKKNNLQILLEQVGPEANWLFV